MSQDVESSVLVESGGFRIDRDRALDKLKRFQLPDPVRFVLPLIRCAVASGAASVGIRTGVPGGFSREFLAVIGFDGRPFTMEELADPCSALFEEARPENARNRDLALALLTALRYSEGGSGLVSVSSGERTGRFRIQLSSPIPDKPPSFEARDEFRTIVGVLIGFDDARLAQFRTRLGSLLKAALPLCPVPVALDGATIPRGSGLDPEWSVSFGEGGVSGWLSVPADLGGLSSITACRHGVVAGSLVHANPGAQVEGWINDDLFTLNASQTGVVGNERFEAAMALAAPHVGKLLLKVIKDCREDLQEAARIALTNGLLGFLRDCIDHGSKAGTPGLLGSLHRPVTSVLLGSSAPDLVAIRRASRRVAWLLDACERVKEGYRDQEPLSQALWRAPLFLGTGGETISLTDIRALARRMGFLPVSRAPMSLSHLPFVTVWLASDRHERVLRGLAPMAGWREMTSASQTSGARFQAALDNKPVLDVQALAQFGFGNLLVRDIMNFGPGRIEVGIPNAAPEKRAKIYAIEGSRSRVLEETPLLGFVAVMDGMRGGGGPGPSLSDACSAAADCASRLFQRLAAEYRPGQSYQRNQMIMRHLLFFLTGSMEEASAGGRAWRLPESRAWAEGVLLFKTGSTWIDYRELRARFEKEEVLAVRASVTGLEPSELKRAIVGEVYAKDLLADILPDAGFLDIGGQEQAYLAFKRTSLKDCEHKSGLGCLAAVGEFGVHLTVDEHASGASGPPEGPAAPGERRTPAPGERLNLPWGTVTAFGSGAKAAFLEAALAPRGDVGLAMATALVERFGTLWDRPGSACRCFLLRALTNLYSPWPGILRSGSRLDELLWVLPMFRSGLGAGLTWDAVARKLSAQAEVTFSSSGAEDSSVMADLSLDALELEAVRSMWPKFAEKLKLVAGSSKAEATGPAGQESAAVAVWSPCPSSHTLGHAPSALGARAVFSGQYVCEGLKAKAWIDASGMDCLQLFMAEPGSGPVRMLRPGLPLLGCATILRTDQGPGQAHSDRSLVALFAAFYADLVKAWPLAPLGDFVHRAAVLFVLKLLVLNAPAQGSAGVAAELDEVLGAMWALKLFGTLGSDVASLADLGRLGKDGFLPYAEGAGPTPAPRESAGAPILRGPERVLVETLLSQGGRIKLRYWALEVGPPQSPKPPPPPEPAAPISSGPSVPPEFEALRRILAHTRGTRGARLLPDRVRWAGGEDGADAHLRKGSERAYLVHPGIEDETIVLARSHPMIKAVADSGLDKTAQGLYLASLVFTRFNELKVDVTDSDDTRFHEAMAEFLAREAETPVCQA